MNETLTPPVKLLGPPGLRLDWPSHLELPSEDGLPVENATEQYQNAILTSSLSPLLDVRHPDGNYFIGQDVGIYYDSTEPPLEGCRAPDWYYVPGVPTRLDGIMRHSYVLWRELRSPLLLVEQISRTGTEERDRTPNTGKFWIYENVVRAQYYLIYDPWRDTLEGYALRRGHYAPLRPNERGHLVIRPLQIEAGLWFGRLTSLTRTWLRFFNSAGDLLLTGEELAQQERARAEEQQRLAQQEQARANEQQERAEQAHKRAEKQQRLAQQERQRAEQERLRAEQEHTRAEAVAAENERLRQRLRDAGLDPDASPGDKKTNP